MPSQKKQNQKNNQNPNQDDQIMRGRGDKGSQQNVSTSNDKSTTGNRDTSKGPNVGGNKGGERNR